MTGRTAATLATLLLMALLAQAPAGLIAAAANRAGAGTWALNAAQGTVWQGSARLLALEGSDAEAGAAGIATLHWDWQPAALARATLAWRLDAGQSATTELRLTGSGLALAPWRLALPASALDPLLRRRLPLREASGAVQLETGDLNCTWSWRCAGSGKLIWRGARLVQLSEATLGSFSVELEGSGEVWRYLVSSLEGPLRLSGSGSVGGGFSFQGEARLDGGEGLSSLAQLLASLGPRDTSGNHRIDFAWGSPPAPVNAGRTAIGSKLATPPAARDNTPLPPGPPPPGNPS